MHACRYTSIATCRHMLRRLYVQNASGDPHCALANMATAEGLSNYTQSPY